QTGWIASTARDRGFGNPPRVAVLWVARHDKTRPTTLSPAVVLIDTHREWHDLLLTIFNGCAELLAKPIARSRTSAPDPVIEIAIVVRLCSALAIAPTPVTKAHACLFRCWLGGRRR